VKLEVYRGDSKTYELEFLDEQGNKLDLTNVEITFTVKRSVYDDDSQAIIQKIITSHTDPTNGITRISLTPADTDKEDGVYVFDIQMKDSLNNIKTLVVGRFYIKPDVTRSV